MESDDRSVDHPWRDSRGSANCCVGSLEFGSIVYSPAHMPRLEISQSLAALGFNPDSTYVARMLPTALGSAPASSGVAFWFGTFAAAALVLVTVVVLAGSIRQVRSREGLSLAAAWGVAILLVAVIPSVLPPVWFYAACLGVLSWITIGALPSTGRHRIGLLLSIAWLTLMGLSSISHNSSWYEATGGQFQRNVQLQSDLRQLAVSLDESDVRNLYGGYADVMTIGYAGAGRLHPSAIYYDRFPLDIQPSDSIVVWVNVTPSEYHGEDALDLVSSNCAPMKGQVRAVGFDMRKFRCPASLVSPSRAG